MAAATSIAGLEGNVLNTLVTGGAGFIGSHLCAALLQENHDVTCIDNLVTGTLDNLRAIREHPRFQLLQQDVTRELPPDLEPDLIFHLASPASVPDYLARPLATMEVNSLGTWRMLELARRTGARFLFTSTSEIYGDPLVHPQQESYWGNVNSIGPRACYDESKRFGEALTFEYWRQYEVNARVVRIFNTYGPHSRPDDGRIVPNFIVQALQRQPMTIYGDGQQTRSFCYVSDLVRGLLAAMFQPATEGEVFNLGNPEERTVLQFAEFIAGRLGSDAGVVFRPLPVNDPTRRCPDISRARAVLGWEPEVELGTGIDRTAEWFREILQMSEFPVSRPH